MWGIRTETIPVIIGALGAIKKGLEIYLGRIPGQLFFYYYFSLTTQIISVLTDTITHTVLILTLLTT